MGTIITNADAIPEAPYYVLSDDTFMSDWGEADGRLNTLILPAVDRAEAEIVAANARNRDEQRNVRILDRRPALSSGIVYSLLTRESAARWYTPGAFAPEPADQPYNGWSNYKTWVTDLWLTNDEETTAAARAALARGGPAALRAYVHALPAIRQALNGQAPVPDSGLVTDLYNDEQQNARETRALGTIIRDALAKVNWEELAAALREE